jgi:tripartite-type tricarboxylate transporter receptor subunit TctC
MATVSASPETKKRLESEGAEPAHKSASEFGGFIKTEMNKWAKVVKAAGIKGE